MDYNTMGKKVFFIYPHSVIQNELIQELVDKEYEVYLINDHNKVSSICEHYHSPIIFINIDKGMEELQWEKLIRSLLDNEETAHARIGIVTYNETPILAHKYLMDMMVPCGFIKLKLGLQDSIKIIEKTLDANEVKGKRKYVRAKCNPDEASLNLNIMNRLISGTIIDISSVGMAVTFDSSMELEKNSHLKDIQLKLKGILIRVSAVVLGHRSMEGEKKIYVLIFDQNVTTQIKSKLRSYINKTLQHEMEKELNIR